MAEENNLARVLLFATWAAVVGAVTCLLIWKGHAWIWGGIVGVIVGGFFGARRDTKVSILGFLLLVGALGFLGWLSKQIPSDWGATGRVLNGLLVGPVMGVCVASGAGDGPILVLGAIGGAIGGAIAGGIGADAAGGGCIGGLVALLLGVVTAWAREHLT
jgi:hypothetical protein